MPNAKFLYGFIVLEIDRYLPHFGFAMDIKFDLFVIRT